MKKTWIPIFLALWLALPLAAEEWRLDAAHSKLRFTAEARFLSADGQFRKFEVKNDINEKELEKSSFDMTVDIASIDTNVGKRDDHLCSDAFFDAANYPTGRIVTKQIRKISDKDYEADGEITLRGVTKPIKLPARILLMEGGRVRFRGTIELNRQDFGIKYNSMMNKIEDVVSVTYELNFTKPRQGPTPTPTKSQQDR